MNKDNRTSNLTESTRLISDVEVPAHAVIHDNPNLDTEALFLLARSGSHNEKITYSNLKQSLLDNVVFLSGNQLISGEKIFADTCTFNSRMNVHEIIDNTITGDISGNIFVAESGLLQKLGVGDPYFFRTKEPDNTLEVSGDSSFVGQVTITGDVRVDGNRTLLGNLIQSGNIDATGEINLTGDAYLENVYVTGEDGVWAAVKAGSDEVTSYKTRLTEGSNHYVIDFPKSYGSAPVLSLSLEDGGGGGAIIPFMVSGVTTQQYGITFGSSIPNENYYIHTTARSAGQSTYQKTTTQTLFTDLTAGKDSYFIEFTTAFEVPPVVSCVVETTSTIRVPHLVSGISTSGYSVKFNSNIPAGYKIHTHAVR